MGSDILASEDATTPDGVVTPAACAAVLARTESHFPPELLNRLDATLVFNKLSRSSLLSVVDLRLADVAARVRERRITLDVEPTARSWLAEKGYSEVYGARAVARVVRTEVLEPLARLMLGGEVREGDKVVVKVSGDGGRLEFGSERPGELEVLEEAPAAS